MSGVEDLNCLTCTLVLVFSKCLCLSFLRNSNDLTYVPKSPCVWWVSERQGHLELSSDSAKNTETQIYKITQIEGVFCQFFVCFLFGVFCHPWSLTRVVKSGEGLRVILVLGCFYKGWGPIASLKQNQDVLVWFGYNLAQLVNTECFRDAIVLQPLSMNSDWISCFLESSWEKIGLKRGELFLFLKSTVEFHKVLMRLFF